MNYEARLEPVDPNDDTENMVLKSASVTNRLFDVLTILLMIWNASQGLATFVQSLALTDRLVSVSLICLGLYIAIRGSHWEGKCTKTRLLLVAILWTAASCLLYLGESRANSVGMVGFAILSGWCIARLRGESITRAVTLSSVFLMPLLIASMTRWGYIDALESYAVYVTSLFADFVGQPNVQVDNTVVFRQFIADHFACNGDWDSVTSYLSAGVLCILAFRRSLLPALLLLGSCIMLWLMVRSISWVSLSVFSTVSDSSQVLPFHLEFCLSMLGIAMVFFQDKFLAFFFKPIPFSLFTEKSPFFAYIWNWVCFLPNPILRFPSRHKIARHWRRSLQKAGKISNFRTDLKWFKIEFVRSFKRPRRVIEGVLEAFRGWRSSRSSIDLIVGAPTCALLSCFFLVVTFSFASRNDNLTDRLAAESDKVCSTDRLETACFQAQEKDFAIALSGNYPGSDANADVTLEVVKRYVEILSKRILLVKPNDHVAKFRLGMIDSLNGDNDNAEMRMREITNRKLVDFPQANSWLAKHLIIKKANGGLIPEGELQSNLHRASRWAKCEYRLMFLYSSLLEANGETQKAVEIAKLAVASNPSFILDLARLYVRTGDDRGRLAIATQAEAYFSAEMKREDNESHRLAVSDARLLKNQLASAGEILSEGLRFNVGGDRTRRQLSEIQRMIYLQSVPTSDRLDSGLDLTLLEAMVDSDPSNPNISSEIAKLLATKTKPSQKLLASLNSQIDSGIASATCHLILGEKYFTIGNLKGAQRHWEVAVKQEPNNVAAINNLAICLAKISPTNLERSIELVTRANSLLPNNVDVLDTWGEVSMIANRPRDAVNKFEWAIKHDSNRLDIRKKLIVAYQTAGLNDMSRTQQKIVQGIEENIGQNSISR